MKFFFSDSTKDLKNQSMIEVEMKVFMESSYLEIKLRREIFRRSN